MFANLSKIKVGDRVWVGTRRSERQFLNIVARLTPTLILCDAYRYNRKSGVRVPLPFSGERITGIATEPEIAEWNRKIATDIEERKQRAAELAAKQQLRQNLQNLFPHEPFVNVTEYAGATPDRWEVTFYNLSLAAVKQLAAMMQKAVSITSNFEEPETPIEHDGTIGNAAFAGEAETNSGNADLERLQQLRQDAQKFKEGDIIGSMKTGKEYIVTNISARHLGDMHIKPVKTTNAHGLGRRVSMSNSEFVLVRSPE